jgi:patatin-like phospholipase/acyl hydrolase
MTTRSTFKILSFDGGGIRGAFAAAFVAETEKLLGRPVSDHFDLVAGTSTGALIALALAFELAPNKIADFYLNEGRDVFSSRNAVERRRWRDRAIFRLAIRKFSALKNNGVDLNWILAPKYDPERLRRALERIFAATTLEKAKRRLVIPAVDLTKGQTVVFKTAHCPNMVRDRGFSAVDVAMAATAAPTYFPAATIERGSAYVDGGLWANDPALVAYVEGVRISEQCKRDVDVPFTIADIRVLSIGTGKLPFYLRPPSKAAGIMFWAPQIIDLIGLVQSQGVNFQMKQLLGDRYRRLDFIVPNDSWRLDHVAVIEELLHLGRETAREQFAHIASEFLVAPGTALSPYTASYPDGAADNRSA